MTFITCSNDRFTLNPHLSDKITDQSTSRLLHSHLNVIRIRMLRNIHKIDGTDFFALNFTNINNKIFINFVHNFARECQSTGCKNFLPHIGFVATVL